MRSAAQVSNMRDRSRSVRHRSRTLRMASRQLRASIESLRSGMANRRSESPRLPTGFDLTALIWQRVHATRAQAQALRDRAAYLRQQAAEFRARGRQNDTASAGS